MKKGLLNTNFEPPVEYSKGQVAQWHVSATICGQPMYADNEPSVKSGDVGGYQVKSERATVCDGTTWEDFINHVRNDKAKGYIYVVGNKNKGYKYYYLMTRREYIDFVSRFSELDSSSAECDLAKAENRQVIKDKRRLGRKFKAIEEYLEEQTALSKLK